MPNPPRVRGVLPTDAVTDANELFDQLQARYVASLPLKRLELAQAWARLADQPPSDRRSRLQDMLHRLAGSAPAYGLEEVGKHARAADLVLIGWDGRAADPGSAAELAQSLEQPMRALLGALDAAGRHADAGQSAAATDAPLRVIVVDGDRKLRESTARSLCAHGCAVEVADHSSALWQLLATWPCDVVLLDYWLRGETAHDVAAMVRRESSFSPIALVCCTSERDPLLLQATANAGCDAVIDRPATPERLLALLHACVERRRR